MKITPGTKFKTVDDYFDAFPSGTKAILKEMRKNDPAGCAGSRRRDQL